MVPPALDFSLLLLVLHMVPTGVLEKDVPHRYMGRRNNEERNKMMAI